jgi:hypothetical protein
LSLRTNVTLALAGQNAELAAAHDELYPERVAERIPLSITLLYPWIPVQRLTDAERAGPGGLLCSEDAFYLRADPRRPASPSFREPSSTACPNPTTTGGGADGRGRAERLARSQTSAAGNQ